MLCPTHKWWFGALEPPCQRHNQQDQQDQSRETTSNTRSAGIEPSTTEHDKENDSGSTTSSWVLL